MGEAVKGRLVSPGVLFLLVMAQIGGVLSNHGTSQCVQFAQTGDTDWKGDVAWDSPKRRGYYTVGTKETDLKWQFLDRIWFAHSPANYPPNSLNPTTFMFFPFGQDPECPYPWPDPAGLSGTVWKSHNDFCPIKQVDIKTYAVKQDGKVMAGWLHVEIKLTDPTDEILAIYVQMRDEFFNAIGEFVTKDDERCPSTDPSTFAEPSKFQAYPCSAVGFREAKISHAMVMAQKENKAPNPRKPGEEIGSGYVNVAGLPKGFFYKDQNLKTGVHFTWRFSEYWCNRHLRIRPEAIIFNKKKQAVDPYQASSLSGDYGGVYRRAPSYWIKPNWFGAADIKHPHSTLTCDEPAINYDSGTVDTRVAPWLNGSVKSISSNDYVGFNQTYYTYCKACGTIKFVFRSCQADTWIEFGNSAPYVPTFAGRCTHHYEKTPRHSAFQGCNLNDESDEFEGVKGKFESYKDYTEALNANRTSLCATKCQLPETETEIKEFKARPRGPEVEKQIKETEKRSVISRRISKGIRLFQGHKYHAAVGVVWSVFFTPISIFAARYYKETCMGAAVGGIGVWLIIHGGSCVAVLSLFSTSYFATKQNVNTWGHIEDTYSDIHRFLGYTSVGLFVAMFIMGGLRCGRDVNGTAMRKATMTMHSLVGFAHYYINLGAIILSCLFAGSPAVIGCEKGTNVVLPGISGIMIATCLWLLFDSVFHIILSVLLIMTDRRVGIRRPWYCPIVPFLPPYANNDMRGSKIRKILFLVYVAVSFVFTVYMVAIINEVENDGDKGLHCTYKTECKEVYGCSDLARSFAEKRKKRLEALGITVDETSDYFRS